MFFWDNPKQKISSGSERIYTFPQKGNGKIFTSTTFQAVSSGPFLEKGKSQQLHPAQFLKDQ
jgi:hypothetical protein